MKNSKNDIALDLLLIVSLVLFQVNYNAVVFSGLFIVYQYMCEYMHQKQIFFCQVAIYLKKILSWIFEFVANKKLVI